MRRGSCGGFVLVLVSVSIHGIGNGGSPIRGRKGHPGGTGTCMQSRQQFYFLQVIDMGMKRTCRGEFRQGLGKKRPQRVLPTGYETNYLGGNEGYGCISLWVLTPLYRYIGVLSRKKHLITSFFTNIVDLHRYSRYTCVVGTGLLSTSRRKPT